jgi:FkbH-like protein
MKTRLDAEGLPKPSLLEIRTELKRAVSGCKKLCVCFLRNITLDTVVPYFQYLARGDGLDLDVWMGPFDSSVQAAMSEPSLLTPPAGFIIVAHALEGLSEALALRFAALTPQEREEQVARVTEFYDALLGQIRRRTDAPVLVHNFPRNVMPALGILDSQREDLQNGTILQLNRELHRLASQQANVHIVDLDGLQSLLGARAMYDWRYWHIARAPYSRQACRHLAGLYMRFVRALQGRTRKCLVLDCDNTLWGGVVGEVGMEGIQIGSAYPGSAYRDLQLAALELRQRGVLLALCSKNEPENVLQVLKEHPDMVLRPEHFVAMRINWNDKAGNLRQLGGELNIGLDSFVFVDDSAFEINHVRNALPEVATIHLPEDPSEFRNRLLGPGYFDSLSFSKEDQARSEIYRAEAQRKKARRDHEELSLDEYLRMLEMRLRISSPEEATIGRISQLTQRTNQYNLTTQRYSQGDVRTFVDRPESDIRCVRLEDKYGDTGIVALAILIQEGEEARVDSFLMSCRVIGRKVETALLSECIRWARDRECKSILGRYKPTAKNALVKDFYPQHGFVLVSSDDEGDLYRLELTEKSITFPDVFAKVETDLDS